jgi:hypothetical protein
VLLSLPSSVGRIYVISRLCELGAPFLMIVNSVIPFSNQYSTWSASVIPRSQIPGSGGLFESKLVRSYTWNLYLVTVLPGLSCLLNLH